MIGSVKTQVVVKLSLRLQSVELRPKKAMKIVLVYTCEIFIITCTEHTLTQSTKLRIMISSVKTKVVVRFDASEMM